MKWPLGVLVLALSLAAGTARATTTPRMPTASPPLTNPFPSIH